MSRICIYFKTPPEKDRFILGDRYIIPLIRNIVKGKQIRGVEKVFINLCKGFDNKGIPYKKNLPFNKLKPEDKVIVLGIGKSCLKGYNKPNPIIAGIALMSHPSEWPNIFQEYPVKVYLQHSSWAMNIYKKYYDNRCDIWPVGIDTTKWKPSTSSKTIDIIVYDKILFDKENQYKNLLMPIVNFLKKEQVSFKLIKYGTYAPEQYYNLLNGAKAMLFLCEHESQGIAYQEAMSMNIPIFAWNQGKWLDPNRFLWGEGNVDATSVPYFDDRCGMDFKDFKEFEIKFLYFWDAVNNNMFNPRQYIVDNLTLEKSTERMLEIIENWSST